MSKSIYEEALENIKDNYPLVHPKSYKLIKESYDTLEELIEKAKKQEKLLELYKSLITIKSVELSCCEVVDDDYYDIELIRKTKIIVLQIKDLEVLLK